MGVTISSQGQQPYRQIITAGNHTVFMDVRPEKGGQDTAPDPHQMLMGAWGACTNMTVQMYAQRKGWPLTHVVTTLNESVKNKKPFFEKNIQLYGQLTPEQVKALKDIAEKCPVNKLIMGDKTVESRVDLVI